MMNLEDEISSIIGKVEGETLEYKAVLPPSRSLAQQICAFGNKNGGLIIIGVSTQNDGLVDIIGLSEEFNANAIVHKALDLIDQKIIVDYKYIVIGGKRIYVIKIEKAEDVLSIAGVVYIRDNKTNVIQNPNNLSFHINGNPQIRKISYDISSYRTNSTVSKIKLLDHYESLLKIIDDLSHNDISIINTNISSTQEGRILIRIIFSSIVDNFETYLSDLLFEIYLSNPSTLKSKEQVTLEEVLNCSDLQDFILYIAKQKISKLQKGSVKGFIKDNKLIKDLNIIDNSKQLEIENILQIRHLYAHRNGIVDEKFLKYFTGQFALNSEHKLTIDEILDKLNYLIDTIHLLDGGAIEKYGLSI